MKKIDKHNFCKFHLILPPQPTQMLQSVTLALVGWFNCPITLHSSWFGMALDMVIG